MKVEREGQDWRSMKALILAGGLGTRLREETEFRPKPMVKIGERPILWHIMKHLASYGIDNFVIAAGYKAEIIREYFLNYGAVNTDFTINLSEKSAPILHGEVGDVNWTVTVADTGTSTLTAGRVLRAARYLGDGPFLVTYGDGLSDVDIRALYQAHVSSSLYATVTTVRPRSRFGRVTIDNTGRVTAFDEKPLLESWVNAGFFIMERECLNYLRDDVPLDAAPLHRLVADGQLGAYRHKGFWQPMDTIREVQELNMIWESGKAPWKTW